MKVTGLLLITLGLVAAHSDYHLKCTHSEMGIRWPSYKSNSEYFICHRLGDRPMNVNCKPGEVFTFVLQVCTSPSRYIPAPKLELLPTASPLPGFLGKLPLDSALPAHPPVLDVAHGNHHHQHQTVEIPQPPMTNVNVVAKPPHVVIDDIKTEVVDIKQEEHNSAAQPPVPPTPAPTPPVVAEKTKDEAKKPHASVGKKPVAEKKSPAKKSPAKPGKSEKTKPAPAKDGKKTPKKTAKKPAVAAPAKKVAKAPTKA